jgi:hypothetical protein
MSVYTSRYRGNYSDIAKELLHTIPWNKWSTTAIGELLYDTVFMLAYYSKETAQAWGKKHPECPRDLVESPYAWYWISFWASQNNLDYYLERS